MKAYYEHAGITIYHGDCLEVLPTIRDAHCIVTDPPYPVNSNCWGDKDGLTTATGMGAHWKSRLNLFKTLDDMSVHAAANARLSVHQ